MIAPLVLAVDFYNFTYKSNPCSANVPVPVVMSRGSFAYFDQAMGAGFDLHIVAVKEGSLAPRTRQAVVVIACDFPADGGTAGAYLYDERSHGAVFLKTVGEANWGTDWGAGPDSIHIQFAHNVLSITQCKNNTCAENMQTAYTLRAGKLVQLKP